VSEATVRTGHGDGVEFREVIAALWSGRWWILVTTLLMSTAFAVVAFLSPPVYRASTVLIPASVGGSASGSLGSALGSLAGVASMVGIGLESGASSTDEALAVLQSRQFLYQFIQDEKLLVTLVKRGLISKWLRPETDPTLAAAHKTFLDDVLTVAADGKTGLVTLSIDWRDREIAAAWANELVARLNAEMRHRALEQADVSLRYLEDELKRTSQVGIQEAINRLVEGQINKRMLANVTKEYSFRIADRALPPDEDDPIRPSRGLLIALGFCLGALLSAFGVLLKRILLRP
jgi:uncharacterized protein involved in exopolysaccharide biosynthesis